MGITTSTFESAPREDEDVGTSTAVDNQKCLSKYGFSDEEVGHLSKLRRFVCCHAEEEHHDPLQQQQQQRHHPTSFVLLVWKYSLLLSSIATTSSSSSSSSSSQSDNVTVTNPIDTMAALEQQLLTSTSKIQFLNEYVRIEKLLNASSAVKKINVAFRQLFNQNHTNDCDNYNKLNNDQLFLEKVAAIILGSQYHIYNGGGEQGQNFSLEFLLSACTNTGCVEGSFKAKDVIELCFEMASLYHRVILQDSVLDGDSGMHGSESTIDDDDAMIQSMTNSMLEYVENYRANEQFHYGANATSSLVSFATSTHTVGSINRTEFTEWQRKVCPDLLQSSVSRFLQVILFPPQYIKSQRMHSLTPFPTILSSKEITSQTYTATRRSNGDNEVLDGREMIIPLFSPVFGANTRGNASSSSSGSGSNNGRAVSTSYLSPSLFAFTTISLSKFGECWYQIYDGENDGWTFQSMEHAILGYTGPTLFIIRGNDTSGTVTIGAYTASNWEKNRKGQFFGNSDCFLFQLQPTMRVLKSLPKMGTRGGNYMYLHSTSNISNPSRKDDLALGIGFGGTVRRPRLFIDSQLEECIVSAQDTSFEEGHLGSPSPSLSDSPFSSHSTSSSSSSTTLSISSLEIYAVGDKNTIRNGFQAQCQHRDIVDATLRNARTVDKAAFLGDMRSGIIESKAFAHRGQVDGRANGFMKGEERK